MVTEGTTDNSITATPEDNSTAASNDTTAQTTPTLPYARTDDFEYPECVVPCNVNCEELDAECLNCSLNDSCLYGKEYNVTCRPISESIVCLVS